jgi:hypothetical protein
MASLFDNDLGRWYGMAVLHDDEATMQAGAKTSFKSPSHGRCGLPRSNCDDSVVPAQIIPTLADD